jgi:K(+)-stimulated pyrophosphate-energized sodium pump
MFVSTETFAMLVDPVSGSASGNDTIYLWIAIAAGVLALVAALLFARSVLSADQGTADMQQIASAIREGAEAFMARQYKTIAIMALVLAAILYAGYRMYGPTAHLALRVVFSFLVGAACSGISGYTGMFVSIRANLRTAAAARTSLKRSLQLALHGGAVTGLIVVGLALLGISLLFLLVGGTGTPEMVRAAPYQLVGFGFGASLVALFAQLGGGIYTKAADVGADLVGKVEAGIPEDDPRNPAVIADLVGDNVGDCAGRGADIFESSAAESVGAMILGAALYPVFGLKGILFPLIVHAINIVSSIVGVSVVGGKENDDPMHSLNRGFYVTSFLALLGFAAGVHFLLQDRWWLLAAGGVGIITSFLFVSITEYYTETRYRPVQSIAQACTSGPATNIITGLAVGMETPALPVIVISCALLLSYYFGVKGLEDAAGIDIYAKGIYGTAIATMGMLSSAAYILAMDTFGPITDNAGGIAEMSNQPHEVRERTDRLDAAGNTTKALTKGYAIGSAALAAFLLFSAYLETVHNIVKHRVEAAGFVLPPDWGFSNVNLASVPVFVGGLLGAMLTYLFSSMAISAVGRAAKKVIEDVRAQFKENPGIMTGASKPDYGRCVHIVTGAALKEMVLPGALAVLMPVAVGVLFRHLSTNFHLKSSTDLPESFGPIVNLAGAEAVAALLMVGTISGILLAMLMNNGGGAWDNAKKLIETGQYGGKGSDAHKAAVVGDTVGDPFKDTAGPSLHVLIKLLATVTLVLAPLFV